jgi:hypothetical protein
MIAPSSSRTVDPRLAAASGVMRDTVGAIHNLQHLLGSVKVGPKALARVIPDVHASCAPMMVAARDLVATAREKAQSAASAGELAELVVVRMRELERALDIANASSLRASDRLNLESTVGRVVRDLDGALELVELLVEASATSRVPVDVTDVVRESANRPDTGSGRGKKVRLTIEGPGEAVLVRVNPRLALRVFAFAVAAAAAEGKDGVHTVVTADATTCRLVVSTAPSQKDGVIVAVPPLIDLSFRCAAEVARGAGGSLEVGAAPASAIVTFPVAQSDA